MDPLISLSRPMCDSESSSEVRRTTGGGGPDLNLAEAQKDPFGKGADSTSTVEVVPGEVPVSEGPTRVCGSLLHPTPRSGVQVGEDEGVLQVLDLVDVPVVQDGLQTRWPATLLFALKDHPRDEGRCGFGNSGS